MLVCSPLATGRHTTLCWRVALFLVLGTSCLVWPLHLIGLHQVDAAERVAAEPLVFSRDIQPILADHCYQCHGPDAAKREADLRLDLEEAVFAPRNNGSAVVRGKPEESELWRRITSADPNEQMPPPESDLTLSAAQRDLLKRWIAEGAAWGQHWSYERLRPTALPRVQDPAWPQTPVDHFILHKLESAKLAPAPQADRATLIRRLTLDLTGLPPTPAEVDAFLADQQPGAYERLVDRLLASPRYGEQMAVAWLDAARYADTSGYQTDGVRQMWRWRDWVIDSMNQNMPFDQFTILQMAGDLLPQPTVEQLTATGFHRNHRANSEGGIIDEEFLIEYAVDRVETTGTVWLGMTIGCARCHDHKYDPVTQRDFYRLMAFFNNVPERGRVFKNKNSEPWVAAPTPVMQQRREALRAVRDRSQAAWDASTPQRQQAQAVWEQTLVQNPVLASEYDEQLAVRVLLDGDRRRVERPVDPSVSSTPSAAPTNAAATVTPANPAAGNPTALEPTRPANGLLMVDGDWYFVPGPAAGEQQAAWGQQAVQFDGKRYVDAGSVAIRGDQPWSVAAWVRPEQVGNGAILSVLDDTATRAQGFSLHLNQNRLAFHLGPRWIDDALRLETRQTLQPGRWYHLAATYDGSESAAGVQLWIDGQLQPVQVQLDKLTGGFQALQPLRIGHGAEGLRLVGQIADARLYRQRLQAREIAQLACRDSLADIARIAPAERTLGQSERLAWNYVRQAATPAMRQAYETFKQAELAYAQYESQLPTTMILSEQSMARGTFVLKRGQYDQPGDAVEAGVPDWLPSLPDTGEPSRLRLARWLVSADHPLTARVTVNRYWQHFFGRGLVETAEDFGTQGLRPIQASLLDWLALRLIDSGWDVKQLHRLLVLSAVYRQSSKVTPEALSLDPENRLWGRGPRIRLPAETIRDQMLAAANVLESRIGGPSVKTYQPDGLWEELGADPFQRDGGAELYRRSLYIFWKRTIPPPVMATFDGPTREFCQVRRARTNTPLQALALLNDVTYVEAARELAKRLLLEPLRDDDARLQQGFRLLLARTPAENEMPILRSALQRARVRFQADPESARQLLSVGANAPSAGSAQAPSNRPAAGDLTTTPVPPVGVAAASPTASVPPIGTAAGANASSVPNANSQPERPATPVTGQAAAAQHSSALTTTEWAAYTVVASMLMNLDETITRE